MVLTPITEEEKYERMERERPLSIVRRPLAQDLMILGESPDSVGSPKNVVLVMDGLKEFTMEPLEWVLNNIALEATCSITLLGVMPWLNIPLSCKTWSDIWTMDTEDLSTIMEKSEWKSDVKYQKVQQLLELCQRYGVKPQMRSEMGYPLQLVVVEHIISLHPTLVLFDRHHQKYREYYAKRIPCNMLMMNEEGEVDIIKGRSLIDINVEIDTPPDQSPASSAPSPILIIAENLMNMFRGRAQQRHVQGSAAN